MLSKILFAALAGLASSTDLVKHIQAAPGCVFDCYNAATTYLGCATANMSCLCSAGNELLIGLIEPCAFEHCNESDAVSSLSVMMDVCNDVGGNPSPEEYSSASSIITAAATQSGNSTTSVSHSVTTPSPTAIEGTTTTSGNTKTAISSIDHDIAQPTDSTTTDSTHPNTSASSTPSHTHNAGVQIDAGLAAVGGAFLAALAL
ncbi:hypothetical protein F5Y19DRAFT_376729 [Xylariaceae sp. FL1651]|nr:hypothetical protein F5Y19DRAFT_376729 [Xylariaceae sp. FL1651]